MHGCKALTSLFGDDAVSFDATLADYDTTTFVNGSDIFNDFVTYVANAANVDTSDVDITGINPGSVIVSTTVNVQPSQASTFRSMLTSGGVFPSTVFGDVVVSSIKTNGVDSTAGTNTTTSGDLLLHALNNFAPGFRKRSCLVTQISCLPLEFKLRLAILISVPLQQKAGLLIHAGSVMSVSLGMIVVVAAASTIFATAV